MSEVSNTPSTAELELLFSGTHHNPHSILGAHEYGESTILRVYLPKALSVTAIIGAKEHPYTHISDGLWQLALPYTNLGDYRLEISYPDTSIITADPYRFLPTLSELDLYLFAEGRHEKLWEILGSHVRTYTTLDGSVTGVSFAVWAPHAHGVSVIGDFNFWDRTLHPMRKMGDSGVWELFIPGVQAGTVYKYCVRTSDGTLIDKADPLAQYAEVPPATGSIVCDNRYEWTDNAWIHERAQKNPIFQPMSVYEVHLGSWKQGLTYQELAEELTRYILDTGFTHVEFLPVTEHPFGGSWGYQVTSYYAPTSRFGNPNDFRYLIDTLHKAGIGVIIDWVPAHFPKDAWALARFDGTALYEHADPKRGEQLDWGTYVFDFGNPQVRNFLVANAIYWFDQFHVDGLRVDAVASMLYLDYSRPDGSWQPNKYGGRENLEAVEFLQEVNGTVHKLFAGIVTIAEESTAWPGVTRPTNQGGLGFSMKWNMGWMHDTLSYFRRDPVHRGFHHHEITFSLMYAWSENFLLPLSHDEVVHGKSTLWSKIPGDSPTKAAGLRTLLAYQWAHPGKQLIFMGQEFGQTNEWNETQSLSWGQLSGWEGELHSGILTLVSGMNKIYREHPALWELDNSPDGYSWIEANDSHNNVSSFLRYSNNGGVIACIFNFSGSDHGSYRLGLPYNGIWHEVLNTDATIYQGRGIGNFGTVKAKHNKSWHGRPHSAEIILPAHTAIWLVPEKK